AGIQSPGLTASPAVGVYIKDLLKKCGLILTEKSDIIYENPPHPEVRSLSDDEISELAKKIRRTPGSSAAANRSPRRRSSTL
ncbi:MAG: hypothetical protein J6S90_00315, partial [Lentisphaeria bacterium]|nr:hypothetical protein [Lentisphaeria bacterium]